MARLTSAQVRLRAVVLVGVLVLTFVLILLGMVYAGTSEWFLLLVLVVDLPALAILYVVDWAERSHG